MKHERKIKWLAVFIIWLVSASSVYGETDRIRVVHTDWFPYTYQENGSSLGFEIDIFKEVMETMNVEVEIREYPWKRCLAYIQEGSADVIISLLKTPEREKYIYFPETYISVSKTVFFASKDQNIRFDGSFDSLRHLKIGVISGFTYGDAFDSAGFLQKDEARNAEILIKKLLGKRHELAAENQAVVKATAKKMGVEDQIQFMDPPIHTQYLYVGFSKKNGMGKLCRDFSKALAEFKSTEKYHTILTDYGIKTPETQNISQSGKDRMEIVIHKDGVAPAL